MTADQSPTITSLVNSVASTRASVRTVGVEEELLLIDAETGGPAQVAGLLLQRELPPSLADTGELVTEVKQEQIEVVGAPHQLLPDIAAAIRAGRDRADAAARRVGARTVAMATSATAVSPHLVDTPRYQSMLAQFGLTMREQLTCGFHIHVAIDSPEEGVAVLDRLRIWLPVILALSSNSPMWQGQDSGYASYRYQTWRRWPTAGPYEPFGSAANYNGAVEALVNTGVLLDEGMVYFDARLSRNHPTVEIRIADVCLKAEHAAALAALARALVETESRAWRDGRLAASAPTVLLSMASWRASKSGVDDSLLHPRLGVPCSARSAADVLLNHVHPVLAELGEASEVEATVEAILVEGSGATRQRRVWAQTNDVHEVINDAITQTHARSR